MKKWIAMLLVLVFVFSLVACGAKEPAEPATEPTQEDTSGTETDEPGELQDIVICLGTEFAGASHPAFKAAVAMGYFAEEGLNPTFVAASTDSACKMLMAGEYTVAELAPAITLAGIDAGMDLVHVFAGKPKNIFGLVSKTASGIQTLKDMEGHKLGYSSDTDFPTFMPVFAAAGVDTDQIEFVLVGDSRTTMLQEDAVDIIFTWEAEAAMLNETYPVTYFSDDDYVKIQSNMIVATREMVENNPDLIARICRAYAKGQLFTQLNPEAVTEMTIKMTPSLAENRAGVLANITISSQLGNIIETGTKWGFIDEDRLVLTADIQKQYDFISDDLDVTQHYTNDIWELASDWDYAAVKADAENWTGIESCRSDALWK